LVALSIAATPDRSRAEAEVVENSMKGRAKGAASFAEGAEAEALAYEAAQTPETVAKARSATAENERRISK
jgi:hypothetical protein